jgi:MFS family permease
MLTIGIVLLVRHTTGSYGAAGTVAAATGVSMALAAPRSGRLADRFGQRAVLLPGVLLHAVSAGLLTVLALSGAPLWALIAAAVPTGASVPQIGPMVRARWAARLGGSSHAEGGGGRAGGGGGGGSAGDSPLPATAAAFESVTDEFTFVIGPVLATALCTGVHPAAGLAAEAALTLVGGLLFAAQRRTAPAYGRTPGRSAGTGFTAHEGAAAAEQAAAQDHAFASATPTATATTAAPTAPGVRVLAVAFLGIGAVFGGMQVSLTAFAEEAARPGLSGVLYGVFASGNMLAGVVCGAIAWKASPRRRLLTGYAALTAATAPMWAAHSVPLLGALGLAVGLCVAPSLITGYTLVEILVPATARTEAFTWLTGAVALGQAAAVTVAGRLADAYGAGAGFTVPLAGTALALAILVTLRRHLAPRLAGPGRVAARGIDHRTSVAVD